VLAVNRLFSNNIVSLYPELNELSIDNSIAFNVAVATSDNNAVNKGQLDTELALKPDSTSVTNCL
jgi:hypothetical protein